MHVHILVPFPSEIFDFETYSFACRVHFYRDPSYFFVHYLVLASTQLSLSSVFRLVALLSPDMVKANSFGGLALLILILTSGFAIIRRKSHSLKSQLHRPPSCCPVCSTAVVAILDAPSHGLTVQTLPLHKHKHKMNSTACLPHHCPRPLPKRIMHAV